MAIDRDQRVTSPLALPGEIAATLRSPQTDETREIRRELLIGDLARRILADLDPDALARNAVATIGNGLGLDFCALFSLASDGQSARAAAVFLREGARHPEGRAVGGVGRVVEWIKREGELVLPDTGADYQAAGPLAELARAIDAKSMLVLPVMSDTQIRSVLVLAMNSTKHDWPMEERMVVREASSLIATAQRQADLLDEARHVGRREQMIRQIARALRSSISLDHVLRTAAEQTGRAISASRLTVFRCDPNRTLTPLMDFLGGIGVVDSVSPPGFKMAVPRRIHEDLIAARGPILLDAGWSRAGGPATKKGPEDPILVCPIVARNTLWGVVEMAREDGDPWTSGETALVGEIGEQLATAVHQAELFEQVLRSKREWESTFDGMSDAVLIYDDRRMVRKTNLSASEMLNKPLETLVGTPCCELGLCSGPADCNVARAFNERNRVVAELFSPRTYHALLVTIDPVIDESGTLIGGVQVIRDLNELRRVEAELRRQQQFLVNLIEAAHDAIFVVDIEGRLVWSNSHLPHLTGRLVAEMLGAPHTSFLAKDDIEDVQEHFQAAVTGETRRFEGTVLNAKTAEEKRLVGTFSPIHEDGKVVSVLGIARDVTDEKRAAERAQQADKLRALGQLASGVAHDVNNDLAAILGRVQRLMRDSAYDTVRRDLEVIETAALDCAQTVRRIQNFARQQGDADFESVDLNGLVRDAVEITRTRWLDDAQSRGVRYTVEFEAQALPPVFGDRSQLREVFVNLIINAIDAMPDGGALRISSEGKDGEAVVRLTDEGAGIPKAIRARIFEPFFTTKGALGTGMGLAVSYGIVTRHSGRIEVDSEIGRGSTFTLGFPESDVAREQTPAELPILVGPLKVLVIDDEAVVREVLSDLLDDQGHTVTQARSGQEGLDYLASADVDVVFTDLSMPEMDGWAVARAIRERHPAVKVVMVTGYGNSPDVPGADSTAVDMVMGKPFEYDSVAVLLQKLVGTRTSRVTPD